MGLYNLFHRVLFGLKDYRDGTGIYRTARELRREQYLPPDELDRLRLERLRRILLHARDHSRYYRAILEEHRITIGDTFGWDEFRRVPLLTREILQERREEILCANASDHYADSSGGSTGRPVNFYHDLPYQQFGRANELFYLGWMGVRPGDRTAIFWGADRDLSEESFYTRLMLRLNRVRQLNSFSMSDARIDEFLDLLDRFRPRYIYGYASSLHHVAQAILDRRRLRFRPTAIRSSAEMLYDFQREAIEEAFGAPVYNFYGSREVNNVAAECSAHDGLHVFASGRIVEILDDDGNPMPPGEVGNIAVTDLTNFAFPFVRYLNGDLAAEGAPGCSCGRAYPRLERIVGRSSDMIVVNGRQIHGEYFTHLFYHRPEVAQFQLVQETEQDFKLYMVIRDETPDTAPIRAQILEKLGPGVTLEIKFTDAIAPTAGGKHRFTVSLLNQKGTSSGDSGIS